MHFDVFGVRSETSYDTVRTVDLPEIQAFVYDSGTLGIHGDIQHTVPAVGFPSFCGQSSGIFPLWFDPAVPAMATDRVQSTSTYSPMILNHPSEIARVQSVC